jgi:hypothetical protein
LRQESALAARRAKRFDDEVKKVRKIPRFFCRSISCEKGFFYSFNVKVTGLAAASLPQGPCGLPGSAAGDSEEG